MPVKRKSPARGTAQGTCEAAGTSADVILPRGDDWFTADAERMGIRRKAMYSLPEVKQVTGISYQAIYRATKQGYLRTASPKGMSKLLTRPEWVCEWIGALE